LGGDVELGVFHNDRVFLIIEDKTIDTARYNNSWKEQQVLGELFVSAHNAAMLRNGSIKTPTYRRFNSFTKI
jgi:hypothetical protein